jgi:hypothetical protein
MSLTIHPELQSLIPSLSPEELAQLEANVLNEGCRDPLIVWQQEQTLLDGHHRLRICEQHGLDYRIQELSLPDLDSAKLWMLRQQRGRRNLSPNQLSYFRGKEYEIQKRQGQRTDLTSGNFYQKSHNTATHLAQDYQVSEKTIRNDFAYSKALDTLADAVGKEVRDQVRDHDRKLTQQDVKVLAKIATQSPYAAKQAIDSVEGAKTPKQARHIVREKAREARDYEQYMDAMVRSEGLADWPRPHPPEVQQRAWDQVYIEELGRRLMKALESLERLHAHLTSQPSEALVVQLPDLLEHQAALGIKLGACWGHVETLLRQSETVRTALGTPPPTAADAATAAPASARPPFDTTKFVLGKLCPGGHEHGRTGKSLLRLTDRHCPLCHAEKKRQKRQAQKQAVVGAGA